MTDHAKRGAEEILVHLCCAPCFCEPRLFFQKEGIPFRAFFFNPNIHPLLEFRRRLKSVRLFAEAEKFPLDFDDDYGLPSFLDRTLSKGEDRCHVCYKMRLEETARKAMDRGIDTFTTTLLLSPFQKHELVRKLGEEIEQKWKIRFYYKDFRPLFESSWKEAKRRSFYRQQYCGCIFSEFERYRNSSLHLYRKGS